MESRCSNDIAMRRCSTTRRIGRLLAGLPQISSGRHELFQNPTAYGKRTLEQFFHDTYPDGFPVTLLGRKIWIIPIY